MRIEPVLGLGGAGVLAGTLAGLAYVGYQWSVTGSGAGHGAWLVAATVMLFVTGMALLCAVLGLLLAVSRRTRRFGLTVFLNSAACALFGLAGVQLGGQLRTQAMTELARRSMPLVEAIGAYAARRGAPPPSLQALVPEHLDAVPDTGLPVYPTYRYVTGARAATDFGADWAVYVETPNGLVNWDLLYYVPGEQYPDAGGGGAVERLGRWAYVHE